MTEYLIYLTHLRTLPADLLIKLLRIASAKEIWESDAGFLIKAGVKIDRAGAIMSEKKSLNLKKILQCLDYLSIKITSKQADDYPALLKQVEFAPPLLYYRGTLPPAIMFLTAVVGSRKITTYGQRVTKQLTVALARVGVGIVSGLAFGVDAAAHQACLECGGKTFAVIGSGLDVVYPRSHQWLADEIVKSGGALISEFPPGVEAMPYHFPQRNRIVAGMSNATLVIQAAAKSGALITASQALEQNREVLAVPGNIFDASSEGTNRLIANGAIPVINEQYLLETLKLSTERPIPTTEINLSSQENEIYKFITQEPVHIDKIVRSARLDISTVNKIITSLELKNLIKSIKPHTYYRT